MENSLGVKDVQLTGNLIGPDKELVYNPLDWLSQEMPAMSLNMFQVDRIQSQGDNSFQANNCFITTDTTNSLYSSVLDLDLKFLDSTILAGETCNMDRQNMNMASTVESLNLSSLVDFNCDFSSDMPIQEQSYDLNSISDILTDQSFFDGLENSSSLGGASAMETSEVSLSETKEIKDEKRIEMSTQLAGKKYMEMRRKNNIASQRSRKIRKQKDSEMADKLKKLEKENKDLLLLSQKLEEERDMLKSYLLTVIAKR